MREHGVFDYEVMRTIVRLTEALEDEVPFVYEVTSLASAERIDGVDDGIEIRALRDDFPSSQEELLTLRERYLGEPLFVGGIVSEDGRYGAIIIEMDRSSTDPLDEIRLDPEGGDGLENLYPQVTDHAIKDILARPEFAGLRVHHSGDVPLKRHLQRGDRGREHGPWCDHGRCGRAGACSSSSAPSWEWWPPPSWCR